MWDWRPWRCLLSTRLQNPSNQGLLPTLHEQNDAVRSNYISFSTIAGMLTSWLNRRRRRYLLLIFCSPFLLPLFFATCPFICAVEICLLMCRKRRKATGCGGDGLIRSGNGGDEVGLLHRYLDDQLMLVVESVHECGDVEEGDGVDVQYFDSARPLLK